MTDARFGRIVRARRLKLRLRQRDVGTRAGVAQSVVSAVENGRLEAVSLRAIRRVARVVGIDLELDARLPAGEAARLLDGAHAGLVELIARRLRQSSWEVVSEFTFSVYGERGSVDLIGWHPASKTLAIIEVKTRIVDVQDLLSAHDRKVRLVPRLLADERGWKPSGVARILVLPRTSANRNALERHRTTIASAYPDTTFAARTWVVRPASTGAVWMVSHGTGHEPWQARQATRGRNGNVSRTPGHAEGLSPTIV